MDGYVADTFYAYCGGVAIVTVYNDLGIADKGIFSYLSESEFSKMFFFDDYKSADYFWKQFFSGAFIAVVMTGLDQDMMQKNLTCKSIKDAQKNMFLVYHCPYTCKFCFYGAGAALNHLCTTKRY